MTTAQSVSATDAAIGARLNQIAWQRRVTRADIAQAIGLRSGQAVSKKMHGVTGWRADELLLACRFLGTSVAELFDGLEPSECAIRDSNPEPADVRFHQFRDLQVA